jgi:hypothetical protein
MDNDDDDWYAGWTMQCWSMHGRSVSNPGHVCMLQKPLPRVLFMDLPWWIFTFTASYHGRRCFLRDGWM